MGAPVRSPCGRPLRGPLWEAPVGAPKGGPCGGPYGSPYGGPYGGPYKGPHGAPMGALWGSLCGFPWGPLGEHQTKGPLLGPLSLQKASMSSNRVIMHKEGAPRKQTFKSLYRVSLMICFYYMLLLLSSRSSSLAAHATRYHLLSCSLRAFVMKCT